MRVEHRPLRLAQIEAADHADLPRVRFTNHFAEQIAAGRKVGARIVERHPRRILGDDAAHVHQKGIGAEVGDRRDQRGRVDGRVRFAQIGLQEADRLALPPPLIRGLRLGRADQEARDGDREEHGEQSAPQGGRRPRHPHPWRLLRARGQRAGSLVLDSRDRGGRHRRLVADRRHEAERVPAVVADVLRVPLTVRHEADTVRGEETAQRMTDLPLAPRVPQKTVAAVARVLDETLPRCDRDDTMAEQAAGVRTFFVNRHCPANRSVPAG